MNGKVIILMGSERDLEFSQEIAKTLKTLGVKFAFRVASAHKTPEKVLKILREYENEKIVYVTVAGRSNALSAFVDANTSKPVIACPPYSDKFGGVDIYSSLRVPSGVASLTIIEPEGAALAASKILAMVEETLATQIEKYQEAKKKTIEEADSSVKKLK
jgi:5-(carboxyamino)imidazole ribonucleotide mutase